MCVELSWVGGEGGAPWTQIKWGPEGWSCFPQFPLLLQPFFAHLLCELLGTNWRAQNFDSLWIPPGLSRQNFCECIVSSQVRVRPGGADVQTSSRNVNNSSSCCMPRLHVPRNEPWMARLKSRGIRGSLCSPPSPCHIGCCTLSLSRHQ